MFNALVVEKTETGTDAVVVKFHMTTCLWVM